MANRRNHELAVILDAEGRAFVGEFDRATGAVKKLDRATDGATKAQDKASKSGKNWEKNLKSLRAGALGAVKALGGMATLAGGALAAGFLVGINRTIQWGDRLDKLNLRIGASTEALSEYAFVAERSGVTFDQLAVGWQRQTRRIAEAAKGLGEARGAINELGLDAQSLAQLAPEDQFEVIAQAMQGVANQQDRVRLAMKFWDSEGVGLLQIVNQGTGAMSEMRQEARDLGLTMSRETASQMAEATDEITRIKATFEGLTLQLATDFGPTLVNILGFIKDVVLPGFREMLRDLGLLSDEIDRLTLTDVNYKLDEAATRAETIERRIRVLNANSNLPRSMTGGDSAAQAKKDLQELQAEVEKLEARKKDLEDQSNRNTAATTKFGEALTGTNSGVGTAVEEVTKFIEALEGEVEVLGLTRDELLQLEAERIKAMATTDEQRTQIDDLVNAYIDEVNALEAAEAAQKAAAEAKQEAATIQERVNTLYAQALASVDPVAAATLEYAGVVQFLVQALDDGHISQEQFNETLEVMREQLERNVRGLDENTKKTKTSMRDLREEADPFAKAWERAIERLDDAGVDFWENFLRTGQISMDSVKDIFIQLLAEMAHAAFTRQILLNVGLGGGGNASFLASAGSALTGGGGLLGGAAAGAGGLGLVGGLQALGPLGGLIGSGLAPGGLLSGYAGLASGVPGAFGATFGSALTGGGGFLPFLGAAGGIGLLLGGIGAATGMFDDPGQTTPRIRVQNNQLLEGIASGRSDLQQYVTPFTRESPLGVTTQGMQITEAYSESGREAQAFLDSLQTLDQAVADELANAAPALRSELQEGIKAALLSVDITYSGDVSVEQALQDRFDAILSGVTPALRDFVQSVGGTIEQQIAALGAGIELDQVIADTGIFDGLADAIDRIGEFQLQGESIGDTVGRVVSSMSLLNDAFDILGLSITTSGDDFIALSADFVAAAGGLPQAQQLWNDYLTTFLSPEERGQFALDQARATGAQQFSDIGLNIDDFAGDDGMDRFRAAFDDVAATLSGDALNSWLQAGVTLGVIADAEAELNRIRGEGVDVIDDTAAAEARAEAAADYQALIAGIRQETDLLTGAITPLENEISRISTEAERMVDEANRLAIAAGLEGAATEDLALIHEWAAAQISDASDRVAQAQSEAADQYDDFMSRIRQEAGLLDGSITPLQAEIDGINREVERMIDEANSLAIAAGLQGAAMEDIVAIHNWGALQIADATARAQNSFGATIDMEGTLYGPTAGAGVGVINPYGDSGWPGGTISIGDLLGGGSSDLDNFADSILRVRDAVQGFLDGLLLDDALSPLSTRQRFNEAQRGFDELFAAAQSGDIDALEQLPNAFRDLLSLGADMFTTASGEYAELFARRNDIQALVDAVEIPETPDSNPLAMLQDEPGWIPEFIAGPSWLNDGGTEASFDTGTSFVSHDMNARIHRGEMVIDPRSSDVLRRYGIRVANAGTDQEHVAVLKEIRDEMRAQGGDRSNDSMRTLKRLERLIEADEKVAAETRRARELKTGQRRRETT